MVTLVHFIILITDVKVDKFPPLIFMHLHYICCKIKSWIRGEYTSYELI